ASGFVSKMDKSLWDPVQKLLFLGVDLDTLLGLLQIPEHRITKTSTCLYDILRCVQNKKDVHVKKLAKFVGQIISMSIVLGNITQLMTRTISLQISEAFTWNDNVRLYDSSVYQLQFWKNHLSQLNHCPIQFKPHSFKVVYSDASNSGYGGYSVESPKGVAHGLWTEEEANKSSTWKELAAVDRTLCSLISHLENSNVKWFTDNQNVVQIVSKGSMKSELQDVALSIYNTCIEHKVSLDVDWVPRKENEQADSISRIVDPDDWGLSEYVFTHFNNIWGPYDVDWFASYYNAKVSVFVSKFWNPGCMGIDAFSFDWSGKNGLFVPPFYLISRVLLYMEMCHAFGTLIVPVWRTGKFWPFLCPQGNIFISASNEGDLLALPNSLRDIANNIPELLQSARADNTNKNLRAGGASKAANAGIPDRLFKRHGRWRSETAKDGYVKDDFSKLLSVSQCLGL
ncbi:hypothetical protein ScPMuIL_002241, partial [Solemya velum]